MDDANDSNVYVAELLQQLEELKRKKARRLQKLKKLKKPSSCKQNNTIEDLSYHKAEDISQHASSNKERRSCSETRCPKCRLSLISRESPCIQCLSTEYKENKYQANSESSIPTVRAETANYENKLNSCPKLDEFKSVKENENLTFETLKIAHNNSVSEPVPNRTLDDLNQTLADDCRQVVRKQRKRSTPSEDELGQDDLKKFKLSREISPEKNGRCPNYPCFADGNDFEEGGEISSGGVPNESEEKLQITDTAVVEVVEDSLLHNMSCFLSAGLIGEDEDGAGAAKQLILAVSEADRTKSEPDLKTSSMKVNSLDNSKVNNSVKSGFGSMSNKSVPKVEALFVTGDCVQSMNTFNVEIASVLDTVSNAGIPRCVKNLDNIQTKDFNHSEQMHTTTLCPDIDTQGDIQVEVSTPQLVKKKDFSEVCEDTLNCLPDVDKEKLEKCEAKVYEDSCQDSPHNSQLIEGLKTSDFSSFENSSSGKIDQVVADVDAEKAEDTPSLLDSADRLTAKNMFDDIIADEPYCENSNALVKCEDVKANATPDLLRSANVEPENEEYSLNCVPETSVLKCDRTLLEIEETENLLADDALTADIDFECTSLEVADTVDDLLTKSCKNDSAVSPEKSISAKHTSINVMDEVFTIPETEQLLDAPHCNESQTNLKRVMEQQNGVTGDSAAMEDLSKVSDAFEETQCDTLDQLQTIQDSVFLDAEDSLELGNYKNIPFAENEVKKTSSSDLEELHDRQQTILKYVCCLQSDIDEPVNNIKLVSFNNSSYVFIQHVTWIQVWRLEENRDWTKIFAHQVDSELTLQEICFTKNTNHLVLVMLLYSDQVHCLQFLLFESEARVIKLMEHTHWLQKRCSNETVLLCGLGDLKFATAQGKETFDVFLHVFSSLQDNPRLMMATLGSTTGILHSLCNIKKLPNALMGTSNNMLYVWHLLEARLVTSVCLQLPDQLLMIEKCIWATIENGLVFFMTVCEGKEGSRSCQLLAANLATGFCQIAMTYSFLPSTERPRTSNLKAVYSEPFLAASCEDGGFLWTVPDEYCCAALEAKDVTSITIGRDSEDMFLVAVGNDAGCVNCCSIKCF